MSTDAEAIISLYQRHAIAFAATRDASLIERPWLACFLSHLPDGAQVLDLGCGFGQPIARHLLDQGCSVTGVDSSGPMIAMARQDLPKGEWHEADMRGLDLNRRFHGVLAWNSSFHLTGDDQRALFDVFARHTRPGGVLMFTTGLGAGEALGRFESEPLYHASLDPGEYRDLLRAHGFAPIEASQIRDPDANRLVWLARRSGTTPP
ncbi:MAG: class I SAM-dependent methyltransferase [Pseudomonadota bacterium]